MHRSLFNAPWIWIVLTLAVWLAFHTIQWSTTLESYEKRFLPRDDAIPDSPRQRVFLDNDPYYWLIYAGDMVEQKKWRLRETHIDNTPEGREMHWSQSMAWLMVAFGSVRHLLTGQPWPAAMEDAAIWINPILHLLLTGVGAWLWVRRVGRIAAIIWCLGMIALPDMGWAFHPLRPDHQSLHILFSTLSITLLGLSGLGWTLKTQTTPPSSSWGTLQPPPPSTARRYMIAAGILGGMGLWTGASVQMLTMGAVVGAAIYLTLAMPRPEKNQQYQPELWRLWAMTGAATSLFFYALEYAGAWPGMRLEVNSPLHALSWLCAGELITQLARARLKGSFTPRSWLLLILMGMGLLALPLAVILGPPGWHVAHDQAMKRLHNFILEFYTYPNFCSGTVIKSLAQNYGLLPLLIPATLWLSGPRRSHAYEWALLWIGFAWAVAMGILSWQQVRWLPFFSTALPWLLVITTTVLARDRQTQKGLFNATRLIIAIAIAQFGWFLWTQHQDVRKANRNSTEVVQELTKAILTKHLALQLGAENQQGSFRFICEPDLAGPLYYFGRIPSVTSFYWENPKGLNDATAFFADPDYAQARKVATQRGLTHVMVPKGLELANIFYFMREGRFDQNEAEKTMLGRLLQNFEPPWLRLDYDLTQKGHARYHFGPGNINSSMTIYSIIPSE